MPLFTSKKTVSLAAAISVATLTACGGGGGGGSAPVTPISDLCGKDFTGASDIIITDFSGGTLTGKVEDGSSLQSFSVAVRGSDQVYPATYTLDEGECKKAFTVANLPQASDLSPRSDDALADYTLTAINTQDVTTTQTFLARGAQIQAITAVQLNDSAFNGTQTDGAADGNGITDWLTQIFGNVLGSDELYDSTESITGDDPELNGLAAAVFSTILEDSAVGYSGFQAEDYDYAEDSRFDVFIENIDFKGAANNALKLELSFDEVNASAGGFEIQATVGFSEGIDIVTRTEVKTANNIPQGEILATFTISQDLKINITLLVNNQAAKADEPEYIVQVNLAESPVDIQNEIIDRATLVELSDSSIFESGINLQDTFTDQIERFNPLLVGQIETLVNDLIVDMDLMEIFNNFNIPARIAFKDNINRDTINDYINSLLCRYICIR